MNLKWFSCRGLTSIFLRLNQSPRTGLVTSCTWYGPTCRLTYSASCTQGRVGLWCRRWTYSGRVSEYTKRGNEVLCVRNYRFWTDKDIFIFIWSFDNWHLKLWEELGRVSNKTNLHEKKKEKMFIQIKNIRYYNVYMHKLKLSIKYLDLNITVTSHAEKVSKFTRLISDTRLCLLW